MPHSLKSCPKCKVLTRSLRQHIEREHRVEDKSRRGYDRELMLARRGRTAQRKTYYGRR